MCKVFERIRDAIQSPPGKFMLALAGGLAIGGLAYTAGRRSGGTGRTATGISKFDPGNTVDAINDIQRQQRQAAEDRIAGIAELIDALSGGDQDRITNGTGGIESGAGSS